MADQTTLMGLLKTPSQIRKESQERLMQESLARSQMMLTRGGSTALPGIISAYGAQAAQRGAQAGAGLLRGVAGGVGQAVGGDMGQRISALGVPVEERQARAQQQALQGLQMDNLQSMKATLKRLQETGAPQQALIGLQQAIAKREEEVKVTEQQRKATSAAVAYINKYDPELAKLVEGNPDAANKAVETVNKRLETKVVGDSLLQLNPDTKEYEAVYTKPATPGDKFRLLTVQEKKDRNLPVDVPFQINSKTNKVSAMANIPRQSDATAPTGYRYIYTVNADGQSVIDRAEPIEGTPQADKLQAENDRADKRLASAGDVYNVVSENIADTIELLDDPDAWVAGKKGSALEVLGRATGGFALAGTQQQTLIGKLDTVKANIGFGRLQEMRENSPTGGALGNVSNFEVNRLEAVLNKLDATADKTVLRENLLEVEEQFKKTARAVANDLTDEQLKQFGLDDLIPFRTHTKNKDGSYTPLPIENQDAQFTLDSLPEEVRDVWDFMPDDSKKLFGWTPEQG